MCGCGRDVVSGRVKSEFSLLVQFLRIIATFGTKWVILPIEGNHTAGYTPTQWTHPSLVDVPFPC